MSPTNGLLQAYVEACDYPGQLDEPSVEGALRRYLEALGIQRNVVRIRSGWRVDDFPDIRRAALEVLAKIGKDAKYPSGSEELHAFAQWYVQSSTWWYWRWDLSWLASTYIGAEHINSPGSVKSWSKPLYDAFLAGGWFLHWTEETLYWVAKPSVGIEIVDGIKRLHGEVTSDVLPLYFWHSVLVPAKVWLSPGELTTSEIMAESNAEVRRIMIQRYDEARESGAFIADCGATVLDSEICPGLEPLRGDVVNELLSVDLPGDPEGKMVCVRCIDPSTSRAYVIRVHPDLRPLMEDGTLGLPQQMTVRNAIASTHGQTGKQYRLAQET